MFRWSRSLALCSALLCCLASVANAYEFEVKAKTVGQGADLRSLRFLRPDLRLNRRRITQTLQLHLWDLGQDHSRFSLQEPKQKNKPRVFLSSYMRLDHDSGSFVAGQINLDGSLTDAVDVIPELERSSLQFDMLYAYVGVEGLLDGRVDISAGRLMEVQTLDWFSMDGLKIQVRTPAYFSVEAFAGLRVRETSLLASEAMAPQGTSAAGCQEYIEGSGAWRPIDRGPNINANPFTSDFEYCPQREELMPTWGAALATTDLPFLVARLAYRRSQSKTPGLIGAADRFGGSATELDRGLYPNEFGQAPGWGVNEERLSLSIRSPLKWASVRLVPYGALRYSLLHGLADEAHLGLRGRKGAHSVESELFYSVPTFDGDSIFNVFSSEPYTDFRTTWNFSPRESVWSGYMRGWARRFHSEDTHEAADRSELRTNEYSAGAHAGLRYRSRHRLLRLDGFHEDGYGGLRGGGTALARWRMNKKWSVSSRLSVIRFDDDLRESLHGVNLGMQVGVTYTLHKGVATKLLLEENSNHRDRHQLGVFAVVDLAFRPEI